MAAKQKAPKDSESPNDSVHSELERKVDAMMSVEELPPPPVSKPEIREQLPEPEEQTDDDGLEGAPVLPSTKKPEKVIALPESEAQQPEDAGETPLLPDDALAASLSPVEEEEIGPIEEPAEPEPKIEPIEPPVVEEFEDDETIKAVDEIEAEEATEPRLNEPAAQGGFSDDSKVEAMAPRQPKFVDKKPKRKFWKTKKFWYPLLLIVFGSVAVVGAVPSTRYNVLNTAGVRAGTTVTVLDETTGQPLKNAEFTAAGSSVKTDQEGVATLSQLKLGEQRYTIKKAGFAEVSEKVTLGWGSNPLGQIKLKSVGGQYKITATDFLSKKPVSTVEASSGEANALANDKGELVLTVPRTEGIEKDDIEVKISAQGYRTETIKLDLSKNDPYNVSMVPDKTHLFISKRSGTYDVYKIDLDGQHEEKVLSGTGKERPDSMALSLHATRNVAALVSMREGTQSKSGANMNSLTIIDVDANKTSKIAQSERVQLIGWIGNKLIYVKVAEGAAESATDRHRLVSYDIDTSTEKELASTNYFNDVLMAGQFVYYTPAAYNVNGTVGLFKINADGSNKKLVYDKELWNLFRTSYDKLSISMGQEWFELTLATDSMNRISSAPPVQKTRVYNDNTAGTQSLWAEERDGKNVLLRYDKSAGNDTVLLTQSGIKNPLRWINDQYVVYRVNTNQETADYVVNTDGGEAKKIKDVTDTAGIDRWYYY